MPSFTSQLCSSRWHKQTDPMHVATAKRDRKSCAVSLADEENNEDVDGN